MHNTIEMFEFFINQLVLCYLVLQQQTPLLQESCRRRAHIYTASMAVSHLDRGTSLHSNRSSQIIEQPSAIFQGAQRTHTSTKALALMFTTFSDNPKKQNTFANVIKNWATFQPTIHPVLFFTNPNSRLNALAAQYDWIVMPCPRVNKYNIPVLRYMYISAYNITKAQFYGYVNGDILFDSGLITTLQKMNLELPYLNTSLLSGRRYQTGSNCTTQIINIWKPERVRTLSMSSSLDSTWALDYFFVTRDYPWNDIQDVVIGRVGYDNYMVIRSNELNVSTVDITNTISALHQCIDQDRAAIRDECDTNFNLDINGMNGMTWENGRTTSLRFQTEYNAEEVIVVKRTHGYFLYIVIIVLMFICICLFDYISSGAIRLHLKQTGVQKL